MLISNIYSEAKLRGKELSYYLHYNNPNEEIRVLGELIQKGYEAVIVVPNYDESYTSEFYRRVFAGNTNIILADNTMAGSYFNYVVQSYDLGVKRAFDYLIKQGEGNFLLINDDRWHGSNLVFELIERTLNTFIQIYSPNSELFVISHMDDLNEDFIKRGGITKVLSIKDSNTIIFIGRLKQWGLYCSDRISIVSYGNTELTKYFSPAITAIDCNYGQMAQEIANLIEDDVSENRQFIIQPKLIIRET